MNEPIKSGDVCIVVDGVFGQQSPNIGKQVTVHGLRLFGKYYTTLWD